MEIIRPPAPWMNQDLKNLILNKNNLLMELKNDRSNPNLDHAFKQSKITVLNLVENARGSHFKHKFLDSKGKSSAMWKTVDEMLPGFRNSTDRIAFENPSSKAEEFNEFFASVGEVAFKKSQEGISENEMTNILQNRPNAIPSPNI